MRRPRDIDRSALYAAEHNLESLLKTGGKYSFYGSSLELPVMLNFGSLETAQVWVDHVWHMMAAQGPSPKVVARRGDTKAVYHSSDHSIRLPQREDGWGMTVTTLAHETAHAFIAAENIRQEPAHGPSWQKVVVEILRDYFSPEAALILQDAFFLEAGVDTSQSA